MKRKLLAIVLIALILCATCCVFAGCPYEPDDGKRDITIKVVCVAVMDDQSHSSIQGEWVFPPDVDEMHITQKYDGFRYLYYGEAYSWSKHPTENEWHKPDSSKGQRFSSSLGKDGVMAGEEKPKYVYEKGEYCVSIYAAATIWHERSVKLYITVV